MKVEYSKRATTDLHKVSADSRAFGEMVAAAALYFGRCCRTYDPQAYGLTNIFRLVGTVDTMQPSSPW